MDNNTILVVDDNHINRLFFESSFKKHGHKVNLAENGYQAIELCQSITFALILMDIRMDGIDGIQTAVTIKKTNTNGLTPIIAVSAERFEWQKHPSFTSSMLKPISQVDISHLIETYLNPIQIFDHQTALMISHDDVEIVTKLRQMLIKQLPGDWAKIESLTTTNDNPALEALLHKMLGSAKVCAADLLSHHLQLYKQHLNHTEAKEKYYLELKLAIKKTIKSSTD